MQDFKNIDAAIAEIRDLGNATVVQLVCNHCTKALFECEDCDMVFYPVEESC